MKSLAPLHGEASSGSIRLDGGDVYTWNRGKFEMYISNLPLGINFLAKKINEIFPPYFHQVIIDVIIE